MSGKKNRVKNEQEQDRKDEKIRVKAGAREELREIDMGRGRGV